MPLAFVLIVDEPFKTFLAVFIPLFVTIDPFGMVPLFIGVTAGMNPLQRRRVTFQAVGVGFVIALAFMFLGKVIFEFLGIETSDFKIAGGVLLLVLAVYDLLTVGKPAVREDEMVGVVPLATPLITGPATLTTILVLSTTYGHLWTTLSVAINFALLLAAMLSADRLVKWMGMNAMQAFSKIIMILLAAIAVQFIRSGILSTMVRENLP